MEIRSLRPSEEAPAPLTLLASLRNRIREETDFVPTTEWQAERARSDGPPRMKKRAD